MRNALRLLLGAWLASAGLLVLASPAAGCTCRLRSLAAQVEAASAVFTGTAGDVREEAGTLIASFDVAATYKGAVAKEVEVRSAAGSEGCGVPFADGRTYAVFAIDQGGSLVTDLCAGTTEDLSALSALAPLSAASSPAVRAAPSTAPASAPASAGSRALPITAAAGLFAFVAALSGLVIRASRRPRPIA